MVCSSSVELIHLSVKSKLRGRCCSTWAETSRASQNQDGHANGWQDVSIRFVRDTGNSVLYNRAMNSILTISVQVMLTNNHAKWNFEVLQDLIEGPLLNPKRMEEAIKVSRFIRRLLSFFHPFSHRFSDMDNDKVCSIVIYSSSADNSYCTCRPINAGWSWVARSCRPSCQARMVYGFCLRKTCSSSS